MSTVRMVLVCPTGIWTLDWMSDQMVDCCTLTYYPRGSVVVITHKIGVPEVTSKNQTEKVAEGNTTKGGA